MRGTRYPCRQEIVGRKQVKYGYVREGFASDCQTEESNSDLSFL